MTISLGCQEVSKQTGHALWVGEACSLSPVDQIQVMAVSELMTHFIKVIYKSERYLHTIQKRSVSHTIVIIFFTLLLENFLHHVTVRSVVKRDVLDMYR